MSAALWEMQNAPEVLGAELEERNPQKFGFWEMESIQTKWERRWSAAPARYKPNCQKHQDNIFFHNIFFYTFWV